MEDLTIDLDALWESKIIEYTVDMVSNKIIFLLETINNGTSSKNRVSFNGVSLFYFINNISNKRMNIFKPDEDDYLEFTSISILDDVNNHLKVKLIIG